LSTELVGRTEDKYHTILDDAFQLGGKGKKNRRRLEERRGERERERGGSTDVSLNWNITRAVVLEVTNINFLNAHFTMIYENITSLHVSLIFGTVCQTVLWVSVL